MSYVPVGIVPVGGRRCSVALFWLVSCSSSTTDPNAADASVDGGDACADAVELPFDTRVTSDRTGFSDDAQSGCVEGGAAGGDQIFHLTIPGAGVVNANGGGDPYPRVSFRTDCGDDGTELGCWGGPSCVEAGDLWLVVDSDVGREGPFTLDAQFEGCGAGEECVVRGNTSVCLPDLVQESEPNDDFESAMPVDGIPGVDGSIDLPGEEDYYRIDLEAGQTIVLDTNGCDFENDVSLFAEGDDPDGPALASGSEGFCKHVEAEVPADGTYYFRVSGVWPYVGSYPLVVGVE